VHRLKGAHDAGQSHFAQGIDIARGQSAKMSELRIVVSLARCGQSKASAPKRTSCPRRPMSDSQSFNLHDLKEAQALQ
jgi:hypothetical protein